MKSLQKLEKQGTNLSEKISKVGFDEDTQRLSTALAGIRTRIVDLISQAEQGKSALKMAKEVYQKRENEVMTYRKFLEETDIWLQTLIASINQQHTMKSYMVYIIFFSIFTSSCFSFKKFPRTNLFFFFSGFAGGFIKKNNKSERIGGPARSQWSC